MTAVCISRVKACGAQGPQGHASVELLRHIEQCPEHRDPQLLCHSLRGFPESLLRSREGIAMYVAVSWMPRSVGVGVTAGHAWVAQRAMHSTELSPAAARRFMWETPAY